MFNAILVSKRDDDEMKVGLLATFDAGGASRATIRLHKALNSIGCQSDLYVNHQLTDPKQSFSIQLDNIREPVVSFIQKNSFEKNIHQGNVLMSLMYSGKDLDWLDRFSFYDVIHFHWIAQFVSVEAMMKLKSMGKPLIWTFHDLNPMTGGCHCSYGCEKYKIDCCGCRQMKENPYNVTKIILDIKKRYIPEDLVVVTPSRWMKECAEASAVFRNHRVEWISNSIELDIFQSYNKVEAKKELGIDGSIKTILFVAQYHTQIHKGFFELMQSLEYAKESTGLRTYIQQEKLILLLLGKPSEDVEKLDIPYHSFGYIEDDKQMAKIYSASDVLLLPSLEDNLPNIMLESMACGTPIVAFNTGGISDCVIDGVTGRIVPYKNVQAFGNAIHDVLLKECLGENCRQYAKKHFSQKLQAERHKDLYESILQEKLKKAKKIEKENCIGMLPETFSVLLPYLIDFFKSRNDLSPLDKIKLIYGENQDHYISNIVKYKLSLKSYPEKSVLIWGTGATAASLIKNMLKYKPEEIKYIRGFINGNTVYQNRKVFDQFNLLEIDECFKSDTSLILIAAFEYEDEIFDIIDNLDTKKVFVLKLLKDFWFDMKELRLLL